MNDHPKSTTFFLLTAIQPKLEFMRIAHRSREDNDRAGRHEKQLLPHDTFFRLANAMDLIKDDSFDTCGPRSLATSAAAGRRQQQILEHLWDRHQDLTVVRIINTIVPRVDRPNRLRSHHLRVRLFEACLDVCSNLIAEGLGWGNIDKHAVIAFLEHLLHGIERYERFSGGRWCHDNQTMAVVNRVEHIPLPCVWVEIADAWVCPRVEALFHVRAAVLKLEFCRLGQRRGLGAFEAF